MMKYIQLEYAGFVVFDKSQNHAVMAKKFPSDNVLSAGFVGVIVEEDSVLCEGNSQSLNKSSKEKDSKYLHRKLSV